MENSFFIFTDKDTPVQIERLHICTWEFTTDSSLIEFGFEISYDSIQAIQASQLLISIYTPWLSKGLETKDLYDKLSIAENSRFIFNDSIDRTDSLDGGRNRSGVIHKFNDRDELCILPVNIENNTENYIAAKINIKLYLEFCNTDQRKPNAYFRFWVKPTIPFISMRKRGISKSTIIYDIKVNEKRNIPDSLLPLINEKDFCKIQSCFSFNILPNKYDIIFFDNSSLKSVRTLEYESFNKYLGDSRVKKDELIVVFNKKQNAESYSFFSIYSKERIGPGQFALAILINILCGILLFLPGYRKSFSPEISFIHIWAKLPFEIYLAIFSALLTLLFFIWPSISNLTNRKLRKI